jgi:hypothetical protein
MDAYAQSLLDKIVSMGREIGNLREAYMIVNQRLNIIPQFLIHINYKNNIDS